MKPGVRLPVYRSAGFLAASASASTLAIVPPSPAHYLVCGTRVRQKGRGFLAGTVSERLLREGHHSIDGSRPRADRPRYDDAAAATSHS
ncbi:MAG: hypothetical protein ACERNK_14965, partial [Deltaproteobacteria bacterium]